MVTQFGLLSSKHFRWNRVMINKNCKEFSKDPQLSDVQRHFAERCCRIQQKKKVPNIHNFKTVNYHPPIKLRADAHDKKKHRFCNRWWRIHSAFIWKP